jgi:hypothetical protein
MKMKHTRVLALLALSATALIAVAQDNNDGPPPGGGPGGGGPGGHHHRPPPLPIVLALDTNHDGIIDAGEIANASAALLTLVNSNGVLTTNEYLPPLPKDAPPNAPRPPQPLIIKALDANGDGVIDATEIANASAALKTLDKNGDGVLTPDEYVGPPPRRHPHGPSGGNANDAGGPPPGDGPPDGPPPGNN